MKMGLRLIVAKIKAFANNGGTTPGKYAKWRPKGVVRPIRMTDEAWAMLGAMMAEDHLSQQDCMDRKSVV